MPTILKTATDAHLAVYRLRKAAMKYPEKYYDPKRLIDYSTQVLAEIKKDISREAKREKDTK